MTFNISWLTRKGIGADYIDYDGDYNGGQIVGTTVGIVAGGPALVKGAIQGAKAIGTGASNLTKCGTALGKLLRRECFVAGTLVTLSEFPRDLENETSLWANGEWDIGFNENPSEHSHSPAGSRRLATMSPARTLMPIEQVPLGALVPTKNPEPWEYDFSLPDPVRENWAKITILYEGEDGRVNDVELLRPKSWIESNEIVADTWIPINIPELHIAGRALVTSIEACPAMAAGSGSVVTGRFITRQVNTIARAEIAGVDGTIEIVEGTPTHPFWSVDRNDWIQLSELQEGERLQATDGIATVVSIAIVSTNVPVYNIEVHGEHVYQVGELGLLVHNACVISPAQLQSKFKHAVDFGIFGNANKSTLSAFANAINDHVTSLGTTLVTGTYRGNPVHIFVDPLTKLAVLTDRSGNFISGWKLTPAQLWNVLNRESL
jgi:hypothetical protein